MFFLNSWLILAAVLVIFELLFQSFYLFLAFALACFPAFAAQTYDYSLKTQLIAFAISFFISFVFLFRFSQKKSSENSHHYKSVIDALPGKHGVTLEAISKDSPWGLVKLQDGQSWSAQSIDGEIIDAHTKIIVIKVEGVRLIVAPLKN